MKKIKGLGKNYTFFYPKIAALGFGAIILLGTVLLMLPISVKSGSISFIDALFTSTSATCVTGLIIYDTFQKFTLFGQLVILCLIQVGGLGFITILSVFVRIVKKRMGLREKMLVKESVSSVNYGDVKSISKMAFAFTVACEVVGAAILSTRFIPSMGFKNGLYTSVFLSVSAFCNAGFDVMGRLEPKSSLMTLNDDPIVILTISALVIIGGIGFLVWDDVKENKLKFKMYRLHSKLVLSTTSILLFGGTILFLLFEYSNTLEGMNFGDKLLNAFFASVTPRTAGFNTLDVASMSAPSKALTVFFMLVGGSSGSTAGGIKTTTLAVLVLCAVSTVKNKNSVEVFNKRFDDTAVKKAVSIAVMNIAQIFAATFIICAIQSEFSFSSVLIETTSAMGTVGMSAGITPELSLIPKLIIISMMFIGRLTTLVFALSFVSPRAQSAAQKPKERILVG